MEKKETEISWKWFLILHISLLINSLPGVASKLAGRYKVMSPGFLFFCCLSIGMLGVFAVVWQQVLGHMSLTFALTNKPITVGITQFSSFNMIEWQYLFAAALLATVPVIILFMLIEKHLAAGLTAGGVKG